LLKGLRHPRVKTKKCQAKSTYASSVTSIFINHFHDIVVSQIRITGTASKGAPGELNLRDNSGEESSPEINLALLIDPLRQA